MKLLGMAGGQGGGTAAVGGIQSILGLINAVKLNRTPRPEYETQPGILQSAGRAEQRAQYGFAPTQTAAFENKLGMAMNTDYANSRNMAGGGLAQALVGRNTGQRLGALNQFASDDATKMQGNIQYSDSLRKFLQGESNRQQGQKIAYRMNDENKTGAMLSSGLNNLGSTVNANQALGAGDNPMAANTASPGGFGTGSYFPGQQGIGQGGMNFLNKANAPGLFGKPFGV
jgi:hypothetical protein